MFSLLFLILKDRAAIAIEKLNWFCLELHFFREYDARYSCVILKIAQYSNTLQINHLSSICPYSPLRVSINIRS